MPNICCSKNFQKITFLKYIQQNPFAKYKNVQLRAKKLLKKFEKNGGKVYFHKYFCHNCDNFYHILSNCFVFLDQQWFHSLLLTCNTTILTKINCLTFIIRICSNGAFFTKIQFCPISAVLKLLQYINRRNSFEFLKKHHFLLAPWHQSSQIKVKNNLFQI